MRVPILVVWAVLAGGASAPVADLAWPSWRGPDGDGVTADTGLPERWDASRGIAWRARLPGSGVSTPVVAGRRVFVTSQIGRVERRAGRHPTLVQGSGDDERNLGGPGAAGGDRVRFAVTAFRWDDGAVDWQHEMAAEGPFEAVHDKHNLASPSPVTDGRTVIAWFGTGQVVALDAASGARRWTRHLGRDVGPFEINWGHASSPALYRDLVIFPCYHESRSSLVALDVNTGATRWIRHPAAAAHSYSTPLVVSHDGGDTLVLNSSRGVDGIDPATGDPRWQVPGVNRFPIPMPVHHDGVLYLSRGYRSSPYLAIRLGGRGDVSGTHVLWHTPTGAPYVSSLVHYRGLLYMASELGIATALDPATGGQVWRERLGGVYTASPVAGDGKVYLVAESGDTVILRAGPAPAVLARNPLDVHVVASPAIAHGRLILRGDDEIVAIAGTGAAAGRD